ncbi:hypothetical protein J437_LFUL008099 [Ladona fulva]|uniref:Uncharacterized protein n=1 Tax=Ladona fulva TaxID=123851 RepID=A0A8K0K013_LADFU|nr:hypothetical protein J437_LFUL008099 [Ladona fulva]
MEVRFESPLKETINWIVYAEFNNVLEIDRHRNIGDDYSNYRETKTWSIRSPFPEERRNKSERIQDRWLMENYHGIGWNDGETDHQDVKYILRLYTKRSVVFTKGCEKCLLLSEISSPRVVYDLADLGCPSLKKLKCDDEFDYCWCWCFPKHRVSHYQCSKKNCIMLARWFMTSGKAKLGSSSFSFKSFENFPYTSKIDVYKMVELGFFYSGYGDTVVCHACG